MRRLAALWLAAALGCSGFFWQESETPTSPDRIASASNPAAEGEPQATARGLFEPPRVTFEELRDALSPFGWWISVPVYHEVWQPRPDVVGENWKPYTRGRWAYTELGWTWISDFKDWGWAAFHFGRFALSPAAGWDYERGGRLVPVPGGAEEAEGVSRDTAPIPSAGRSAGWVWVPDRSWSPANVAWRQGENYLGWAPLPPGYSVAEDVLRGTAPRIPHDAWVYLETRHFTSPSLSEHILPPRQAETLRGITTRIRQWRKLDGRTIYVGPLLGTIEGDLPERVIALQFDAIALEFGTRALPPWFSETSVGPRGRGLPSEVRPDVDWRVTIAGPDSPRQLAARKVVRTTEGASKPSPAPQEDRTAPTPPKPPPVPQPPSGGDQ